MTTESGASHEKEPARWDLITADDRDQRDLSELLDRMYGTDRPVRNEPVPISPGGGMILRRGSRAIGYIFYQIFSGTEKELKVTHLHIEESERSPGVMKKLIKMLHGVAHEKDIRELTWNAGSMAMVKISSNIAQGIGKNTLRVEDLDAFVARDSAKANKKT
jgi:hypothetical protein